MTRWLSLHECVNRIIAQYNPLTLYFTRVLAENWGSGLLSGEESNATNTRIPILLKDPFSSAYLGFLKYALDLFNKLTNLTQSPKLKNHCFMSWRATPVTSRNYLTETCITTFKSPLSIDQSSRADEHHTTTTSKNSTTQATQTASAISAAPATQSGVSATPTSPTTKTSYQPLEDIYVGNVVGIKYNFIKRSSVLIFSIRGDNLSEGFWNHQTKKRWKWCFVWQSCLSLSNLNRVFFPNRDPTRKKKQKILQTRKLRMR